MDVPELTLQRARQLRKDMSPPEAVLWRCLRNKGLNGLKFRRQHPLGPYILDFYCDAAKLAVEIDGIAHTQAEQAAHDARRDHWLADQGVRTLRIPSAWIAQGLDGVVAMIVEAVNVRT